MEVEAGSSGDEDLDIVRVVKKDLKGSALKSAALEFSSTKGEPSEFGDATARRAFRDAEKLNWSSEEDADHAYVAFKNRKTLKRKRDAEKAGSVKQTAKGRGKKPVNAVVGKVAPPRPAKHEPVWRDGDNLTDGGDSDGALGDEQIPSYLKARKDAFDEARQRLGNAGLRLPPNYDNLDFSEAERIEGLAEKPDFASKPPARYKDIELEWSGGILPAPIAQWLRDYQVQGAQFLHEHFVYNRGGILGDDMGLGKTIQVISFLAAAFGKTGDERDRKRMRNMRRLGSAWYPLVMIICPGTLISNWEAELDRWGWWQVDKFHGPNKEAVLESARHGRLEIMITTYSTYRSNQEAINMINWDCVIADECHIVKRRGSEITKAMNVVNSLCRIGLTGTAIQNNYDELWTLLNWCYPDGKFGSLASWRHSISQPLRIGQAHDASAEQLGLARRTAQKLVKNLLPPYFLRRMKSLIADQLPKKSDRVVFCPLTETQTEAYANYVDSLIVQAVRNANDPCNCKSGKKKGWCCYKEIEGYGRWQNSVFPSMITLQKLSNHLAQLIPSGKDPLEKQDKDLEHLKLAMPDSWRSLNADKDKISNYSAQNYCGKWKVLNKLLSFWHANGDKVLVFSHSVRLLQSLEQLFRTSNKAWNVSFLSGNMKLEERTAAVNDFNTNPDQFVFLISTKAGGVGLNITSANKVVIFDPNWNPAYDLQAQDRAYRIGQTRDVEVFRLISAGTIEEIVYARQIYKQQQANIGYTASSERRYFVGVQDEKNKTGEIFGLANLFSFEDGRVLLQDIVNKTNVAESRLGVVVANIDMSHALPEGGLSAEDEDEAMSQLAKEITGEAADGKIRGEKIGRVDPVQAILTNAGVGYIHENSEVVGTSKTEAKISRQAADSTGASAGVHKPVFGSQFGGFAGDGCVQYSFKPPMDVRRRQFCTMAKTFGFDHVTDFALIVEGWTQEQRRSCLEKFYAHRRAILDGEPRTITIAPNHSSHVTGKSDSSRDDQPASPKHQANEQPGMAYSGGSGRHEEDGCEQDDEL